MLLTATTADADAAIAQAEQLTRNIRRWANRSQGWFEDRVVKRPRFRIEQDAEGKNILVLEMVALGPYRYLHWREDGKMRTTILAVWIGMRQMWLTGRRRLPKLPMRCSHGELGKAIPV